MIQGTTYRHFQFPSALLAFLGGLGSVIVAGVYALAWPVPLVSLAVVFATLALLFGGLLVEVTEREVRLRFGIGLIRKSIPRDDLTCVERARNAWWYGFGIRLTPDGWLWNVSGLDAVRVTFRDGRHFRIGTDDPDGLLAALGGGS